MKHSIDDFFLDDFSKLDRERTVFVLPIGGLESRGRHLKLNAGFTIATRIAERFCGFLDEELKSGYSVIQLSTLPAIVDSQSTLTRVTHRPYIVRDWLVDTCYGLHELGFKHFAVITSNLTPRQLTSIEEAEKMLKRRTGMTLLRELFRRESKGVRLLSVSSSWVPAEEQMKSLWTPNLAEHGGERETSIALAIQPDLVKAAFIEPVSNAQESSVFGAFMKRLKQKTDAYRGDPAASNEAAGRKWIDINLKTSASHVADAIRGIPQGSRFRTWYSVIPSNKTFFKAWVISIFVFTLFLALLALSLI